MGIQGVVPTQDEFLALCLLMLNRDKLLHQAPFATNNNNNNNNNNNLSFKCSICGKAFSSYQALGGHKSSHRRPPPGLQFIRPISSMSPPQSSGSGSSSNGAHQCNVCYRSFATGQALGGHKRCHYWDSSSTSHSAGSSTSTIRDFDLNLMPASEDEFAAAAAAFFVEDGEEVQSPHPSKKRKLLMICN